MSAIDEMFSVTLKPLNISTRFPENPTIQHYIAELNNEFTKVEEANWRITESRGCVNCHAGTATPRRRDVSFRTPGDSHRAGKNPLTDDLGLGLKGRRDFAKSERLNEGPPTMAVVLTTSGLVNGNDHRGFQSPLSHLSSCWRDKIELSSFLEGRQRL